LLDYKVTTIKNYPACQQLHRFEAENKILQQVQTFVLAKQKIYSITGRRQSKISTATFRYFAKSSKISRFHKYLSESAAAVIG